MRHAVLGGGGIGGLVAGALAAAAVAGAELDIDEVHDLHEAAPDEMRSSMQKDVEARREPELVAIASPIQRVGAVHGFPTPSTDSLVARITDRVRSAT